MQCYVESLQSQTSILSYMIGTSVCPVHALMYPTVLADTIFLTVKSVGDLIRPYRRESVFTSNMAYKHEIIEVLELSTTLNLFASYSK